MASTSVNEITIGFLAEEKEYNMCLDENNFDID